MPASDVVFEESVAGQVIERARREGRLAHALLLHGDEPETLEAFARQLAARLLELPVTWAAGGGGHADYFTLRPSGKSRQIRIGEGVEEANTMRCFNRQLAQSPLTASRKVGVVFEAERMNPNSANAFLKSLEEPPSDTTLLLLTTHPYSLLPTIRSRCLSFRLPTSRTEPDEPEVRAWFEDFRAWLLGLAQTAPDRSAATRQVMTVYALVARFSRWLEQSAGRAIARLKQSGALEDLDDEEVEAIKAATSIGVRHRFLVMVESATCGIGREVEGSGWAVAASVRELERAASLLRVNLSDNAALELFLLATLRAWSRREG